MKKNIIVFLICFSLLGSNLIYAADEMNGQGISAAVLADYQTGDIMYSHNLNKRIEVASITKIMTYLVAMDEVTKGNVSLDDQVTISEKAARRGGSSFKLKTGQVHSLKKLLDSIMVASANDASIALAEHIAGNEKKFAEKMNEKARELDLKKSYFVSVNGFPEEGTHNMMSAKDILTLVSHTIKKYPQILQISSMQTLFDEERGFEFRNTNPLLGVLDGVSGLKTGYADEAGYCLVTTKNTKDKNLISIVMGAESKKIRTEKSLKLLESGLADKYKREKIIDKNEAIDTAIIPGSANGKLEVFAEEDVYAMIKGDEKISKTTNIYNYLDFPVKPGESIGEVTIKYDDNVKKIKLVAKEEIVKDSFINTAFLLMRNFLASVF